MVIFSELSMKAKSLIVNVAVFAMGVLLAGCNSQADRYLANKHQYMLCQSKPSAYVDGYIDGCSAGKRLAGDKNFKYKLDAARMDRDALYAHGWQDGQIYCRNEVLIEQQRAAEEKAKECNVITDVCEERNRRVARESRAAEAEMQEIWEELKK